MKKSIILSFICFICLVASEIKAQSFTVLADTIFYAATPTAETIFDTVSTGSSAVPYSWKVIDCNFPADWLSPGASGFCDHDLCRTLYSLWPSGITCNTTPYDTGSTWVLDLALDLGPASTTGCFYVTVRLNNTSIPTDVDTETWYVCYAGAALDVSGGKVKKEISLFPNPANDILNTLFDPNSGICKLEIIDVSGKLIHAQSCSNGNAKISILDIPQGVYFIRFVNSEGAVIAVRRFIKN